MASEIYIGGHAGLGDHVLQNSILRHYASQYDKVHYFATYDYARHIRAMFADLDNVEYLWTPNRYADGEGDTRVRLWYLAAKKHKVLALMYAKSNQTEAEYWQGCYPHFDQVFYKDAGLPLATKYNLFDMPRDLAREDRYFAEFAPRGDYIFIGHAPANRTIPATHFAAGMEIFDAGAKRWDDETHMDLIKIICQARELHLLNSLWNCFIDSASEWLPELVADKNIYQYNMQADGSCLPWEKTYWPSINPRYRDQWRVMPDDGLTW